MKRAIDSLLHVVYICAKEALMYIWPTIERLSSYNLV